MVRRQPIDERACKVFFAGPEPGTLIQHFKDSELNSTILGKGILKNRISAYFMMHFMRMGIPTHFIRRLNMREQVIAVTENLPIKLVIHNRLPLTLEKMGIDANSHLSKPMLEYIHLSTQAILSESHLLSLGWIESYDLEDIKYLSLRINDILQGYFLGTKYALSQVTLTFGRLYDDIDAYRIALCDEITPDTFILSSLTKDNASEENSRTFEKQVYHHLALQMGIVAAEYDEEKTPSPLNV